MITADLIKHLVSTGELVIDPFDPAHLNPNSYNVRLAPTLYRIRDPELDVTKTYDIDVITIAAEGFVLQPGELYLGATMERTHSPTLVPEYNGRSTIGRYFIISHFTAGYGDLGFNGHWTLEIAVLRPTRIFAGIQIGQIQFARPEGAISTSYSGKYNSPRALPKVATPLTI